MSPNLQHYHVPVYAEIHQIHREFIEEDDEIVSPSA